MKRFVQWFGSGLSLFWRYFFLLALVMGMFLAAMTVNTSQSSDALQKAYLEQTEQSFRQNCAVFADDLFRTRNLFTAISESKYYTSSSGAQAPLAAGDYVNLWGTQESFLRQCTMLNLPGEVFLYFHRASACVTRVRCCPKAEGCFETYLLYKDETPLLEQLQALIREDRDRQLLLPARMLVVDGMEREESLLLLVQNAAKDQICGFFYPVSAVLEAFHMDGLPAGTSLELVGDDGTVLLAHNVEEETRCIRVSSHMNSIGCTVTLGIPQAYFQDTIRSAQNTSHLIFLLCVVLGVGMCVVFSHISVQPFRRLIRDHATEPAGDVSANEVVVIDGVLKRTRQNNAQLRGMLLSGLLVRAFSGLTVTQEECRALSASSPILRGAMRAGVIHDCRAAEDPEKSNSMMALLQKALPEHFLCEYVGIQDCVLLFPAEQESLELLQCVLLDINGHSRSAPRFVCGISVPFSQLCGVSTALRQAKFCIPGDGARIVTVFSEQSGPDRGQQETVFDLNRFRHALSGWEREELRQELDRCALCAREAGAAQANEMFYSVLYLLRDAAATGQLPFSGHEDTAYEPELGPAENLRRLQAVIDDLFERRGTIQTSAKQVLQETIVQYIKEHFSDPSLCMMSLVQEFCVSDTFVRGSLQTLTGMNFSSFLTGIRMEEAARRLRETEESINTVAERCGYEVLGTFYRNFKQYHGVPPAEYKKSVTGGKNA